MAKYRYCFNDGLVTIDWLFNKKIVRVVRRYYNRQSRQNEVWMYHVLDVTKWGTSWEHGWRLQPDQVSKALELAKKNHVNIMGIT